MHILVILILQNFIAVGPDANFYPRHYFICHSMSLVMPSACNVCDVLSQVFFSWGGGVVGQRGVDFHPHSWNF